jgi:hypothetical protein
MGLQSMSMRQYVSKYVTQFPELLDLVAAEDSAMQVRVRTVDVFAFLVIASSMSYLLAWSCHMLRLSLC